MLRISLMTGGSSAAFALELSRAWAGGAMIDQEAPQVRDLAAGLAILTGGLVPMLVNRWEIWLKIDGRTCRMSLPDNFLLSFHTGEP